MLGWVPRALHALLLLSGLIWSCVNPGVLKMKAGFICTRQNGKCNYKTEAPGQRREGELNLTGHLLVVLHNLCVQFSPQRELPVADILGFFVVVIKYFWLFEGGWP